jgi:hypothetical protein
MIQRIVILSAVAFTTYLLYLIAQMIAILAWVLGGR